MDALRSVAVAAICVGAGLALGCNGTGPSSATAKAPAAGGAFAPARPRAAVDVFEVAPPVSARERLAPAVVSTEDYAVVLAERSGVLVKLSADVGLRVREGDVLGEIKSDDLRAQLRQAELEASGSAIQEREYEALLRVNQSEADQEGKLFEDGLSSQRFLDRARYRVEATREELEKTRLATQAARAKVEVMKVELEKAQVRAPIAGIITRRYVTRGTGVVKDAKLFEISQLAPLQVIFHVEGPELGRLAPGSVVRISLADNPQVEGLARVRRIDPTADAQSNTIGLLADLIRADGFIPGAAVNVHVPVAAADVTVWIPRAAFPAGAAPAPGEPGKLFVVEGDHCASRRVLVGDIRGGEAAVKQGLKPGDRVILSPGDALRPGDPVAIRGQ